MSKLDTEVDELIHYLGGARGEDAVKAFTTFVYYLCKRYSIDELIANLAERHQTTIIANFKKSMELIRGDKNDLV